MSRLKLVHNHLQEFVKVTLNISQVTSQPISKNYQKNPRIYKRINFLKTPNLTQIMASQVSKNNLINQKKTGQKLIERYLLPKKPGSSTTSEANTSNTLIIRVNTTPIAKKVKKQIIIIRKLIY